jgi:hypothetical protein
MRVTSLGRLGPRISRMDADSVMERKFKTKQIQITGVGLVDWQREQIQIHGPLRLELPGMGSLSVVRGGPAPKLGGSIKVRQGQCTKVAPGQSATVSLPRLDLSSWDDVDGALPDDRVRNLGLPLCVLEEPVDVRKRVLDLLAL